jgi:peptide deformylase
VMHRQARPVTSYDEELRSLVADMTATMYAADGVGLAACQIGVDLAVFVFDCPDDNGTIHRGVVCNPVVELPEGKDRKLDDSEEGCLSYPGAFVDCARPDHARVVGQGLDGADVSYEGDGLLARCLQHETDHTLGTVFGDRLNNRARKKLRKQMEEAAADYPGGWPVERADESAGSSAD